LFNHPASSAGRHDEFAVTNLSWTTALTTRAHTLVA
jgi:hypothetical protein